MKTLGLKFDATEYHRTIAKAILFKTIDAYYGKDGIALPGYKSNMVAYTLSALSLLSNRKLDLAAIWNEQFVISTNVLNELTIDISTIYAKLLAGQQHISYKIKETYKSIDGKKRNRYIAKEIPKEDIDKIKATTLYKVMESVKKLEPTIWDHIVNVDEGSNINEWTKQTRCWDALKAKLDADSTPILTKDVISAAGDKESEISESQQARIDEVADFEEDCWFSIHTWAKDTNALTPKEIAFIGQFAYMVKRHRPYTYKQAKWALAIKEKAENLGWFE